MKILVIDDEKPTLSMFRLFLTAYGYDVYTAQDGEKGLAMFKNVRPQIVFTDIKMPGMDGLEVLGRIRKTDIPSQVIIITGHGDMEKAVEALDMGASDFINKPVERKALNSALARAEKRQQLPENLLFECFPKKEKQRFVILVKGKLTAGADKILTSLFKTRKTSDIREVHLVFDDSFSIDRSGISLLMQVLQDLKQENVAIVMEKLSYNYMKIFEMAGIDKVARLKEGIHHKE